MPCCLALLAYCLCKYLDTLTVSLAEFPPLPCLPDMNACLFFQTQLSLCDAAVLSRSVVSDFFATPWTVAHQAPLPMGFSRQEYWSGLPCPPPRDLPNPGLPHCRQILYHLTHQGSPRILEWVANPFFRESSQPRNRTGSPALQVDFLTSELPGKPPFTDASHFTYTFIN